MVGPLPVNKINKPKLHPKYLHSNSTSHSWAFGGIAELVDNVHDEDTEVLFIDVDHQHGANWPRYPTHAASPSSDHLLIRNKLWGQSANTAAPKLPSNLW